MAGLEAFSMTTVEEQLHKHGLFIGDSGQVKWKDGNPDHPRNWPPAVKAYGTAIIIFLDFFTTAVGTAGVPASEQARSDFDLSSPAALVVFTSIYLFGQGFGSVIFPPYSESFGRKNLYIVSTSLYAIFCILIAAVPYVPMVAIGRFFTGLFSSIPTIVVAGSIEDLYDTKARVWMVFAWLTVANIGLVIGTIAGSYITFLIGWRWVFWIAGAVTAVASILILFIRESRPSQLLERKLAQIRLTTSDQTLRAQNPDHTPDLRTLIRNVFLRPLHLYTEPIVLLVSVLSAIAFGLVYLFTEAIPIVFALYGFTPQLASLAFIPLGIGFCLGAFVRAHDLRLLARRKSANQPIAPEDKLAGFVLAAPVLAASLWVFAWTIPPLVPGVPWVIPMLALVPVGFAINEFDVVLAGYMADCYTVFAASAFASLSILRSLASATFPLFARGMYQSRLGPNGATSVIAGVATLACVCPWVFVRFGRRIRMRSRFAEWSLRVHDENVVGRVGKEGAEGAEEAEGSGTEVR